MTIKMTVYSCCLLLCAPLAAAQRHESNTDIIRHAHPFAIGGVGRGGGISYPEQALRAMIKRPKAATEFKELLKTATTEGQLYALLGLKLTDRAAFLQSEQPFLKMKQLVIVREGCLPQPRPVCFVAGQIAQGRYDRYDH